jgi:1-phosphofructokinase
MTSVVTVTLNPAIDQTLSIPGFAAGQVNRVAESRCDAGGKGVNVAGVLADLGAEVIATGFLGADNAAPFENLFLRKRIEDRFVRIAGSTRVGIKIVDGHETTDINFPGLSPNADDLAELNGLIAALAGPGRWFVLSGSVPPGVPSGIYAAMIDSIHGKGGCVALDTSGAALREALASRPEVVKPNLEELSELVGHEPGDLRAAAQALGARRVAVSMGEAGALFVDGDSALLARPPRVPVRSTVGAGDAMVAGLVYGMIRELPLEEAARFATACGAYAVTRVGSGIEDPGEHRELMSRVEIERSL